MQDAHVDEAVELLEKANAELDPELLSVPEARERLEAFARAQRLAAFGVAALARKVDDASELARGDRHLGGPSERNRHHRQGAG